MNIGFCILSHADAGQLLALVGTLNRVYGAPPIVCHHDVSQTPVDTSAFPANVHFTSRSYRTGWGRLSVVEGGILAIRELFERSSPDWFVLLSASDYPIREAESLRTMLAETSFDAFIDARLLLRQRDGGARLSGDNNPAVAHFASDGNLRLKRQFCLSREIWIPVIRRHPRFRLGRYTVRLPIESPAVRKIGMNFHYGDHWFMANARAAKVLCDDNSQKAMLMAHLRSRTLVDEVVYQTLLCNDDSLSICLNNYRYAEWNGGGAHPIHLMDDQFDDMVASGAFFARKFQPRADVLDRIDREILGL